jgi:two-component system, OmpR family, phosphate regulon sensor histidine kinase PhoR
VVKRLFGKLARKRPEDAGDVAVGSRGVIELDEHGRVVAASPAARAVVEGLEPGAQLAVRGSPEPAAFEELRAGFTAAVSHELRTPLARLLALLETAPLPGADHEDLIRQAQAEVGQIRELIDDVLFLSELETGHAVVALGSTRALPVLREVADGLAEQGARAGVEIVVAGEETAELPLRPRMIRVIAGNLAENAIRYAGPGSTLTLTAGDNTLVASDDGVGVAEQDLPRLFERFYRGDRSRASRGTGLGLAIVKHVVTSAGGTVEASGRRGEGLTVRCLFTTP